MAIYPDKKDGKLTGRFRVELQKGKQRYRKRWDTLKEAQGDEKAVLAAWDRGEGIVAPGAALGAPEVHTFASIVPLAKGMLWAGSSTENTNWSHVRDVAAILGEQTRLDAIDTHSIDKVIQALKRRGKADGTVNRYLSHLRTFLGWCVPRKYRTAPVDAICFDWLPESEGRIRWISSEEENQLREFLLANDKQDIWDVIDIAIETGCRRDELLTVELGQINGNRLHLWKTKTKTPRTIPMTPRITAKLVRLVKSKTMPDRGFLRNWWINAKVHMGLADDADFVFHTCRHTCATRMVDAGINVFVIQEWMGHKRIETTKRYAHVKPQNLEDALCRVGDFRSLAEQNPSNSGIFSGPHHYPTGGETPHFATTI